MGMKQQAFLAARLVTAMLLALAAAAYGTTAKSGLTIGFDKEAVVISGVSPGGQAVVFGVAREVDDFVAKISRRHQVVTADATGVARYDLGTAVPQPSVWVAVDLATGAVATEAPGGASIVESDFRGNGPGMLASGLDGIADGRPLLDLLVVRPGQGVWYGLVGDGGPADEGEPNDGKVEISLAHLRSVGIGAAARVSSPAAFAGRDVVVAIDPLVLAVIVRSVPEVKP
jgi:hypothetical protein